MTYPVVVRHSVNSNDIHLATDNPDMLNPTQMAFWLQPTLSRLNN